MRAVADNLPARIMPPGSASFATPKRASAPVPGSLSQRTIRSSAARGPQPRNLGSEDGAGEVAVFEAVRVAFQREDLGVVNEPVDHRGGGDVVAEDLSPGDGPPRRSGRLTLYLIMF
jgi:hypothetical protein